MFVKVTGFEAKKQNFAIGSVQDVFIQGNTKIFRINWRGKIEILIVLKLDNRLKIDLK